MKKLQEININIKSSNYDQAKRLRLDLTKITQNFESKTKSEDQRIPKIQTHKKKVFLLRKQEQLQQSEQESNDQQPLSKKLEEQIREKLIPDDIIKVIDLDRIKENEEEFLQTDRRKKLAIDKIKLKPITDFQKGGILNRSIVGESDYFTAGEQLSKQKNNKQEENDKQKTLRLNHKFYSKDPSSSRHPTSNMLSFKSTDQRQSKQSPQDYKIPFQFQNKCFSINQQKQQINAAIENKLKSVVSQLSTKNQKSKKDLLSQLLQKYPAEIDSNKLRLHIKNSISLSNQKLDMWLNSFKQRQVELESQESKSHNESIHFKISKEKETKILENFDKYQHIWQNNLKKIEKVRDKMNYNGLTSSNFKINKQQALKGDKTIFERVDDILEKQKDKEIFQVLLKPKIDFGAIWHCSLRQEEHDNEFDGFKKLEKPVDYDDLMKKDTIKERKISSDYYSEEDNRSILQSLSKVDVEKKNETFKKKRLTFDQIFLCEDDLPLTKRRSNHIYYPCNRAQSTFSSFKKNDYIANNYEGKFIMHQRLPNIIQQFVTKPKQFKTSFYNKENQQLKYQDVVGSTSRSSQMIDLEKINRLNSKLDQNAEKNSRNIINERFDQGKSRFKMQNDSSSPNNEFQSASQNLNLTFQNDQNLSKSSMKARSMLTNYVLETTERKKSQNNICKNSSQILNSQFSNFNNTKYSENMQNNNSQLKINVIKKDQNQFLKQRLLNEGYDIHQIKKYLPCSLEAIDHLDEIYIEGKNKLQAEIDSALRIPEKERRLINQQYLYEIDAYDSDQEQSPIGSFKNFKNDDFSKKIQKMGDSTHNKLNIEKQKLKNVKMDNEKKQNIMLGEGEILAFNYDAKHQYFQ